MLKVAAFTGGKIIACARFRIRQYVPALMQEGVHVEEMYSRFSNSPPKEKWLRPIWGCATLAEILPSVIKSHSYDVVLMQREILSTYVTLEPWTKKPRVLDVDDAIFLYRNGVAAKRLAQISDRVICGNNYLANWFNKFNNNIVVLPTAVDTNRYIPRLENNNRDEKKIIGWIGTAGNLQYLYSVEKALAIVMNRYPNVRLRVVCDCRPEFKEIDLSRCDFIRWSESIEIASIQGMDIGIMPLEDSAWTRGKCSFKMLQYMSCAVPVVVSPVGMNVDVLAMGDIGFGATTVEHWVDALIALLEKDEIGKKMGILGRKVVQQSFSIDALAPRLAQCLLVT